MTKIIINLVIDSKERINIRKITILTPKLNFKVFSLINVFYNSHDYL